MNATRLSRQGRTAALIALVGLLATVPMAGAGTISLAWDPVPDSDLAGYRVYYGTAPGLLDRQQDAGLSTSATLTGLTDCRMWYAAVRAYDTGGLESAGDSNQVQGLPRPVITRVEPASLRQGETATLTVSGANFDGGDGNYPPAQVLFGNSGLVVEQTTVDACGTLRVRVRAASDAATGWSSLTVENPDRSWSDPSPHPWVFGTLAEAVEVLPAPNDTTPPRVTSSDPGAGAGQVPVTFEPRLTFSEALDPASVTASTVQILDASGAPVAQQAGWPRVSGAVVTLKPAQPLASGATYRLFARGGAGGVQDQAGNPLAASYTQSPGFTTAADQRDSSSRPTVLDAFPGAGAVGVSRQLAEVRITFDRDMSGLATVFSPAELRQRLAVLDGDRPLAQLDTSPRFESGGRTIRLLLAESLLADHAYTTMVHLGGDAALDRLRRAGHGDLYMDGVWMTRPAWRVEGALEQIFLPGSCGRPRDQPRAQLGPGPADQLRRAHRGRVPGALRCARGSTVGQRQRLSRADQGGPTLPAGAPAAGPAGGRRAHGAAAPQAGFAGGLVGHGAGAHRSPGRGADR
ncbi:MAG: Ig-like domain-containing protein [Acidobacteriota bacterium]|nr:Ig-like domain-containing protein [Acidobacteriota bacterium]